MLDAGICQDRCLYYCHTLAVSCPPFSYVAVDLAGTFVCKREGAAKRTRSNPGTMKVWPVLIVCLQVKAVKIYLPSVYLSRNKSFSLGGRLSISTVYSFIESFNGSNSESSLLSFSMNPLSLSDKLSLNLLSLNQRSTVIVEASTVLPLSIFSQ